MRTPLGFAILSWVLLAACAESHVDRDAALSMDSGVPMGAAVGEACIPEAIPSGGFSSREVYFETSSRQCVSGICMVYQLEGDPTMVGCDGGACVTAEEVEQHVYCSCRCSAPDEPEAVLCACPSGMVCIDDVVSGPRLGIAGGYCVRM